MSLKNSKSIRRRESTASHITFGAADDDGEISASENAVSPTPPKARGSLGGGVVPIISNMASAHGDDSIKTGRGLTHRSEAGNRTARKSGSVTHRKLGETQRSNSRSGNMSTRNLTARARTKKRGKHPRLRWRGVLIAAVFLFKIRRVSGEKFLRHSHAKDWQEFTAQRSAALIDLCRASVTKPLEKRTHSDGLLVSTWLQPVSALAALPKATVVDLGRTLTHEAYEDGNYVFRVGDSAECAFVVLEGRVEMVTASGVSCCLTAGGAFGLVALARSFPRLTSARCVGHTEVLRIERDEFQSRSQFEADKKLRDDIAFVSNAGPFRTWPRSRLLKLARILKLRVYERGDLVLRQGEPVMEGSIYLVLEGECVVQRTCLASRARPLPPDAATPARPVPARLEAAKRRTFDVAILGPSDVFGDSAFLCEAREAGGALGRRACSVLAASHATRLLELTARNAAKLMDDKTREALQAASYERSLAIVARLRSIQRQAGEREALRFGPDDEIALRPPDAAAMGAAQQAAARWGGASFIASAVGRLAAVAKPGLGGAPTPEPGPALLQRATTAPATLLLRNPTAPAALSAAPAPAPAPAAPLQLLPPDSPPGSPARKPRKPPPPFLTSAKSRLPPPEPPPPGALHRSATLPRNIYGIADYDPTDPDARPPVTLSSSLANRNLSSFGRPSTTPGHARPPPEPPAEPEPDDAAPAGEEAARKKKPQLPGYMLPARATGIGKLVAQKIEALKQETLEARRARAKTELSMVRDRLVEYGSDPLGGTGSPIQMEKRAKSVAHDVYLEFRLKSGLDRPRTSSSFAPSARTAAPPSRGTSRAASSFGGGQPQPPQPPGGGQAPEGGSAPPSPGPVGAGGGVLLSAAGEWPPRLPSGEGPRRPLRNASVPQRTADGRPLTRVEARALAAAKSVEDFQFNNWERPYTALESTAEEAPDRRPWTSLAQAPLPGGFGLGPAGGGGREAASAPAGARRMLASASSELLETTSLTFLPASPPQSPPPRPRAPGGPPPPGDGEPGGYVVLREEERGPGFERPPRTPSGPLVKSVRRIAAPGGPPRRALYQQRAATAEGDSRPDGVGGSKPPSPPGGLQLRPRSTPHG